MKPFSFSAAGGPIAIMTVMLLQSGMATNAIADQDSTPKAADNAASAPQQDKDPAAANQDKDPAAADKESATAPAKEEIDLAKLQAAGYRIVNERGTTLYCKTDEILGSRLRKKTRCLTAAEIEQEQTAASNAISDMSRASQNMPGD